MLVILCFKPSQLYRVISELKLVGGGGNHKVIKTHVSAPKGFVQVTAPTACVYVQKRRKWKSSDTGEH